MADSVPPEKGSAPAVFVKLDPGWVRRSAIGVLVLLAMFQIVVWAWTSLADFLFLLLLAWLLGIALDPIVTRLANRGLARGLATLLVLAVMLIGTVLFFASFGKLLAEQIVQLAKIAPDVVRAVTDWMNAKFNLGLNPTTITNQLNLGPQDVANLAGNVAGGLLGVLSSVVATIFDLFTLLLFAFYFAADGPRLRRAVSGLMPGDRQRVFNDVWRIATEKAGGFVMSRLGLAAISAVFAAGFFWIIDLPYWLALGLWVGLISQFIPTLGTYLAIILPALIALLESPAKAIGVIVFATVYQQVENYFLSPKISQKTMDIHPGIAFGSVIAGAALFGPIGALIGIPLAAAVLAFGQTYLRRYELVGDAPAQ